MNRRRRPIRLPGRTTVIAGLLVLLWIQSFIIADSICLTAAGKPSLQFELHYGGLYLILLDDAHSKQWFAGPTPILKFELAEAIHVWPALNIADRWEKEVVFGHAFLWGNGYLVIRLPFWVTVSIVVMARMWIRSHPRRGRRTPAGTCRNCGYDLRASDNRCPECGREFGATLLNVPAPPPLRSAAKSAKADQIPSRPTDDID